ncbi:hypothetical protein AAHA92_30290 [Salvia divinorum]|uniref:Secreted protein n=1 Tax=Salvia divinorum TaxID=28513 RepID=A0ABD1G130_SALDI
MIEGVIMVAVAGPWRLSAKPKLPTFPLYLPLQACAYKPLHFFCFTHTSNLHHCFLAFYFAWVSLSALRETLLPKRSLGLSVTTSRP